VLAEPRPAPPRMDGVTADLAAMGSDVTTHLTSENRGVGVDRAVVGFWHTYGPVTRPPSGARQRSESAGQRRKQRSTKADSHRTTSL
jgi:hypothetical protein